MCIVLFKCFHTGLKTCRTLTNRMWSCYMFLYPVVPLLFLEMLSNAFKTFKNSLLSSWVWLQELCTHRSGSVCPQDSLWLYVYCLLTACLVFSACSHLLFSPLNCSAFWFVLVGLPRQHLPLYLYLGFMKWYSFLLQMSRQQAFCATLKSFSALLWIRFRWAWFTLM